MLTRIASGRTRWAAGLTFAVLAWTGFSAHDAWAGAIISNGTIKLGVNNSGALNYSDPTSGAYHGVTYVPTGNDGTRAGCACEGWGAGNADADPAKRFSGIANQSEGTTVTQQSFTSTATTATSVTSVSGRLQVTHEFRPFAGNARLYEVRVTLKNIGAQALGDVRYTRLMDWDVEPTPFNEFVTIRRGTATALRYSNDNGFDSNDPLSTSRNPIDPASANKDITDSGPADHGALFDFGFGALAAGASRTFSIFYGAAGTEPEANTAVSNAGAEVFSYGQPKGGDGKVSDKPNTFIFGFRGVGGTPVIPPGLTLTPANATNPIGAPHTVTATLKDSANRAIAAAKLIFSVSGANPRAASSKTTAADGRASYTYTGTNAGVDTISVCYDANANGTCSTTEIKATARKTYVGDVTPPDTTITSGPTGTTTNRTPTFTFVASETPATFACAMDSAAFAPCSTPKATGPLSEGSHTFRVRATDAAGNTDPTPATRTFVVTRIGTQLDANPSVAEVIPGLRVNLRFSGRLRRTDTGTGVAVKRIVASVGGTAVCSVLTATDGTWQCSGSLGGLLSSILGLGYDAAFAGDVAFKPAAAHAGIVRVGGLSLL